VFALPADQLLTLVLLGVASHLVLLAASLRWNPMALLGAAFLIIAPFTTALEAAEIILQLKWGRVYLTVLMTGLGFILVMNRSRLGPCTKGFILFWSLLFVASLWGRYPGTAMAYKLMSATTFLSGVFLALSLKDVRDLRQALRLLALPSALWAGLLWWQVLASPGKIGRLDAFGMNPNLIGGLSTICFALPAALALYGQGKARLFWSAVAALHVLIVLMTGSRASFGALVIAAGCLFLPLVRRPLVAGAWLTVFAISVYVLFQYATPESATRMLDTLNTRAGVWGYALERFFSSPVIGVGSYMDDTHFRVAWGNAHSIYIQILYETGIVGMTVFLIWLVIQAMQVGRVLLVSPVRERWILPAFLAVPLGIGIFESGPILGASSLAFFWGLSIGLADRLPVLAAEETEVLQYTTAEMADQHMAAAHVG
jgi:O-antigen ligase